MSPSFRMLHNASTLVFQLPHFGRFCSVLFCFVLFSSHQQRRSACDCVSVLLPPVPPLALNNTSRHAVRDQLTLKLLDSTLKAPTPQIAECRVLQTVLLIYAQTLPEGVQW